jgi:hypothetical protein
MRYLSCAFIDASHFATGQSVRVQRCYQRKVAEMNESDGIKALSNKLAKAYYYVMRDCSISEESTILRV